MDAATLAATAGEVQISGGTADDPGGVGVDVTSQSMIR
eukprot:SAG31_NODE_48827_length_166_cov_41.925373_1_plen_37_part_01